MNRLSFSLTIIAFPIFIAGCATNLDKNPTPTEAIASCVSSGGYWDSKYNYCQQSESSKVKTDTYMGVVKHNADRERAKAGKSDIN